MFNARLDHEFEPAHACLPINILQLIFTLDIKDRPPLLEPFLQLSSSAKLTYYKLILAYNKSTQKEQSDGSVLVLYPLPATRLTP